MIAAAGALAGATFPPLGPCIRTLWPSLADGPGLRDAACALEATVQEFVFILGPLLVAIIATAAPVAALLTAGACCTLGTVVFASLPASRRWRGQRLRTQRGGALTAPGVQTVLVASIGMGGAFGAVEVAMPAFAERHGERAAGGVILAAWALGSLIGGVGAASRSSRAAPPARYLMALGTLVLGLVPLLLATSIPAMVALALLAGVPIAPCFAVAYGLIDELAPPGTATEAFGWTSAAIVVGAALGSALSGASIPSLGVHASLALAVLFAGLGLLFTAARLRSLSIRSDPSRIRSGANLPGD